MIRWGLTRAAPLFLLLGLIAFLPAFYDGVETAGRYIFAQRDIRGDYFVGVLWALLIALGLALWPMNRVDRTNVLILWFAKVVVVLGIMLFYEYSYDLDSYWYYATAKAGEFSWQVFLNGNGKQTVINLIRLQLSLLPDSYHAVKISFAAAGLFGIYVLYRAIVLLVEVRSTKLFFLIALFPSVLFWSSILGKDPIVFLGVSIYAYGAVRWRKQAGVVAVLAVVTGIAIAASIRPWMAPILALPFAVLVFIKSDGLIKKTATLTAAVVLTARSIESVLDSFFVQTADDLLSTAGRLSQGWAVGGSAQFLETPIFNFSNFFSFIPKGMFTALFRPLPGEVTSVFGTLAGIENLFLLSLTALAVFRTRLKELRDPIIIWAIVSVLFWAAIYGFVSYQNLGSGVRFKLQIMPILLPLLLYLSRSR